MACKTAATCASCPGRIVGPDDRPRRPARLRADAPGPRAAHPPREGDLEHLHQPDAAGARRHGYLSLLGPVGLRAGGAPVARQSRVRWPSDRARWTATSMLTPDPFYNEFLVDCPDRRPTSCDIDWSNAASSAACALGPRLRRLRATACCWLHRAQRRAPRSTGWSARSRELGRDRSVGRCSRAAAVRAVAARRAPAIDCPRSTCPDADDLAGRAAARRAAPARARRARRRAPLHPPVHAQLLDRHRLLSARLVHDEVQPEGQRGRRAAARLRARAPATSRRDRPGRAASHVRAAAAAGCEITGFAAATLQPAAGAQGELAGMLMMRAYHLDARRHAAHARCWSPTRRTAPTPPRPPCAASTTRARSRPTRTATSTWPSCKAELDETTVGLMLTNPNTLGLFEQQLREVTDAVHAAGGLVYGDGANLNAILGVVKPADMGFDVPAHQRPQDVLDAARRRRPGLRAGRRQRAASSRSCRRRSSRGARDGELRPRLRSPAEHRPSSRASRATSGFWRGR